MTSLTKYEKETVITYNQDESFAFVYTCDEPLMRQMDKLMKKDSRIALDAHDKFSKTYIVPKKAVKIRMSRILSDEKRKELSLTAKRNFHNK